jgi:4-alpha-glucanotransferase
MNERRQRRSGLLIPLFSCPATTSWGIGDIGSVGPITAWLSGAGQRALQLLPLSEMAADEQSPYSALSAMAIDPLYIDVAAVPDFVALGGTPALDREHRDQLDHVRNSLRIDYAGARRLKRRALAAAFDRFYDQEWLRGTRRATAFRDFIDRERGWLQDYALFRALHAEDAERPWTTWADALRRRESHALFEARQSRERRILNYQYLQWIADDQWHRAREIARANGVALFGDLPFVVDIDSADVWAHAGDFDLDASVGVPPDAFSATGQDWGLPLYRWDRIQAEGFTWLRERAARTASLFDGYRIDHLVGFYRTYARPRSGGDPYFTPSTEPEQVALGERLLGLFREAGAEIIAEDLGVVPDFVRASLERLGVPGFRVLRWERLWHQPDKPFRDPVDYPANSVAISGTHDTETLAVWWDEAGEDDRRAVGNLPTIQQLTGGADLSSRRFDPIVRDALVAALLASGSNLVLLAVQDVFGWRDRINEPATVSPGNWTFRLPWPADTLSEFPEASERQAALRRWASAYNRE